MADVQKLNVNNTTYDISTTWSKVTGKPSTFPPESHTHSYLPLSGGTMSNQNVVVNLNADLLDGYSGSAYAKKTDLSSYLPLSGGTMLNRNVVTNLNADLLDGWEIGRNSNFNCVLVNNYWGTQNSNSTWIKVGTLLLPGVTSSGASNVIFSVYGARNFAYNDFSIWDVIASTRERVYVAAYKRCGGDELEAGYVDNGSMIEIWLKMSSNYMGNTSIQIKNSINFNSIMSTQSTIPTGYTKGGKYYFSHDGHSHSEYAASSHTHDYLPLSGGTVTGNLFANGYIGMGDYMVTRAHYLFVRDNANADWVVTNKNWSAEYTLIHSGNIGSQSVNYATSAGSAVDQTARNAASAAQTTANSKWTYNADTIKGVKVNNASWADGSNNAGYLTKYAGSVTSTTRSTSHPYTVALFTSGWADNSAGFHTTYGTTLDISGYSSWYHRLAFGTDGLIEHWMGINTNTLHKVGRLCYVDHTHNYLPLTGGTVSGTITATGFYQSSDERLKTFYDPIKPDLEKLKLLKKNYFKFNDKDKLEIGVSAQEVQAIYPEIVSTDDEGYLSVAYDKLSVIALSAIDELNDNNDRQQKEINNLNQKINDLNDQLEAIKNILNEKGIL